MAHECIAPTKRAAAEQAASENIPFKLITSLMVERSGAYYGKCCTVERLSSVAVQQCLEMGFVATAVSKYVVASGREEFSGERGGQKRKLLILCVFPGRDFTD
jgi:hypothetical protein